MRAEGLSEACIGAFENSYNMLVSGDSGMISEASIAPAADLPELEKLAVTPDMTLLAKACVCKLNGGLGTSMGLDKAKSLLEVKGGDSFLDLIAKQIINARKKLGFDVKFVLMNSFSTSDDTKEYLCSKYPEFASEWAAIEMVQNKVPKVDAKSKAPAEWPKNPSLEWCPPGHGDLYATLIGSGKLKELRAAGIKYMFVSNSDNLGADLDLALLTHFAKSGSPFMMECCTRTEADKKGGHLAMRTADGQLILRESAQCADADEKAFQDVAKHRFFNTNNLWLDLEQLEALLAKTGGVVRLPTILNGKTVDPQDGASTKVVQLETAMGAAIELFAGASAIVVPRSRFAPVKKCSDLLLLRSDAYGLVNFKPTLTATPAPIVDLDSKKYKLVGQLADLTTAGVPSLKACKKLTVKGAVAFSSRVRIVGEVKVTNPTDGPLEMPPGTYANEEVTLPCERAPEGPCACSDGGCALM